MVFFNASAKRYPLLTLIFLLFLCSVLLHGEVLTNATSETPQHAEDQFLLGRAYYRGEGVTQSYEQAGIWYRKAADQGNLKAMHNLGIMFLQGQGTPKDEAEGYRWIRKAADGGDPRASYLCGVLLCEGKGVPKNEVEGLSWLKKACDLGNANALARIGRDYLYGGDGLAPDANKALPLIEKAAGNGSAWACGSLGEILAKGELLPKDLKKADLLFQQGAALGDPAAQFEYAQMLLRSNPAKAYPWIKLAVEAHEVRAYGLMTECRLMLTPEQAAAGDVEAEKIRKNYQSAFQSK